MSTQSTAQAGGRDIVRRGSIQVTGKKKERKRTMQICSRNAGNIGNIGRNGILDLDSESGNCCVGGGLWEEGRCLKMTRWEEQATRARRERG